jgi:cytochrome b subunit of formate dehydrogenase
MVKNWQKRLKTVVHWSLLILTLLYLVSGLGITQYQLIEPLTLGLLTKSLAFKIHDDLLIPFIALLCLHILIEPTAWVYSHMKRNSSHQPQENKA